PHPVRRRGRRGGRPELLEGQGRRMGRHRAGLGFRCDGGGLHRGAPVGRAPQPGGHPRHRHRHRGMGPGPRVRGRAAGGRDAGRRAVLAGLYAQFRANAGEDLAQPPLGIFSTVPAIRHPVANLVTEIIATVSLVLPVLAFGLTKGLGESGTSILIVSFLVVGIGLSLGGPTGYAINPARDLGPRVVHALLPIPNKGTSDWGYAWVPVVGPLIGAALSGVVFNAAF